MNKPTEIATFLQREQLRSDSAFQGVAPINSGGKNDFERTVQNYFEAYRGNYDGLYSGHCIYCIFDFTFK